MRRLTGLLVTVLAILSAAVFTDAASAVARVPAGWIGVNADDLITEHPRAEAGEWRRMGDTGVRRARAAFYWPHLQPAPDRIDLTRTDAIALAAASNGITLLPVVFGSPPWAAKNPLDGASSPRDPQDYARFLGVLLARYGRSGTFWAEHPRIKPRPIRVWQIWNEPEIPNYWAEQPWAPDYVRLLRAAHRTIHAADRHATVLAAGLPNQSWADLRTIYRNGGKGTFDAIAVHPYTRRVDDAVRIVKRIRAVQRRYRDLKRSVWLTEMCWPALGKRPGHPFGGRSWATTNRGQASKLGSALRKFARVRRKYNIGGVFWYTWFSWEDSATPAYWPSYCGLRRIYRSGQRVSSPALRTFKRTIRALERR